MPGGKILRPWKGSFWWSWLMVTALLAGGCNIKKLLRDKEVLLQKNSVKVSDNSLKPGLESMIRQKPNKKLGGIGKFYLWMYRTGDLFRDSSWIERYFHRIGEPPVVYDSNLVKITERNMLIYLNNKGYYDAEVGSAVRIKKRKRRAYVNYTATLNEPYRIRSYELYANDRFLDSLMKAQFYLSKVRPNQIIDRELLYEEQRRITTYLKNNGFFYFSKEYIHFELDSSQRRRNVAISGVINNPSDNSRHEQYRFGKVKVLITYFEQDTNRNVKPILLNGVEYLLENYRLRPGILDENIFIRPDSFTSEARIDESYVKLSQLGLFKYINISFKPSQQAGFIDCLIQLVPQKLTDFVIEPQLTTSDQNDQLTANSYRNYGVAATISWKSRNISHRADFLEARVRLAFDAQPRINPATQKKEYRFNANQQNISISYYLPRLWLPFRLKNLNQLSNQRTQITLSYQHEGNPDFSRVIQSGSYAYSFSRRNFSYTFAPIEVNFINTSLKKNFLDTLQADPTTLAYVRSLFDSKILLGSRHSFYFNNQGFSKSRSYWFVRWTALETGGNSITVLNVLREGSANMGNYKFLGLNYYQYLRSEIDARFNTIYDENNSTVFRLNLGGSVPLGNSSVIPYERRFFLGGANSLRGFRARTVGPGALEDTIASGIDRSGELKLEINAEYRWDIFNFLEGATFIDAGNIWNVNPIAGQPGSEFSLQRSYKEIYASAGVGLRWNLTFFILRLDAALPIRDVSVTSGSPWVITRIGEPGWAWRSTNVVFGIGYPF